MPEKTAAEFRDGWFITGDLGLIDGEGYVRIVGRGKDLVISGGLNVYPIEVETEIDALPGVVESAVIGVPHPDFGEGVTAVVVARKDAALTEAGVIAALEERLAKFKLPKRVLFVDDLPRNAMGKVQKAALREALQGALRPGRGRRSHEPRHTRRRRAPGLRTRGDARDPLGAEAMRYWATPPHRRPRDTCVDRAMIAADPVESDDFIVEHEGRVIGKAGLWRVPEIGFIFSPAVWGRGLASEALAAIVPRVFARFPIEAITADIDPRNAASLRVLAKAGFVETGRARQPSRSATNGATAST